MAFQERFQAWARQAQMLPAMKRISFVSIMLAFFVIIWSLALPFFFLYSIFLLNYRPSPSELFSVFIIGMGMFALPTLWVIGLTVRKLEQRPLASIGLHIDYHAIKKFLIGLALGLTVASIVFLWSFWSGVFQIAWAPLVLTPSLIGQILLLILGWLGVAFWEELFFRGYLLQALASGWGISFAVLISSLGFGLVHVLTYGMNPLMLATGFLFGIALATLYLKTKSLWPSIGMHFTNNFVLAHVLHVPLESKIRFPLVTVNGQPIPMQPISLILRTQFTEAGRELYMSISWEAFLTTLLFYGLIILLIWKLPLFRPHLEMEALWQQYVPIAQPWAQLKAWWARRKHKSTDAS